MAAIGPLLKTAARLGPVAYPAVKKLIEVVRKNPELTTVAQDLVDRFAKARAARSKPESLRRSVAVLRSQAQRLLAKADTPAETAQAERWLDQADRLDAAVDLMSIRSGRQQQRDAKTIEQRIDELFAQVFTATMGEAKDGRQVPGHIEGPGTSS